jgi:F-type H+-transporting ATPase subunit delta
MNRTKQAARDAKKLFRLCLVNGLLDEARASQVVRRLGATSYRNRFKVLAQFQRLVRLDCARHTATVESAAPLASGMQVTLQDGLTLVYGPGLNTSFIHIPALIGGMRIQVGSDVYDGTVQARLAALEEQF